MSDRIPRLPFPVHAGRPPATLYSLSNPHMEVQVSDYGGIVHTLRVPDRHGRLDDVVLGFADPAGYAANRPYFGALIGRCANRIAGARFTLDGTPYSLTANEGATHLHGGRRGFDKVAWEAHPFVDPRGQGVTLAYDSPHGEEGYPGTVRVRVVVLLTPANELVFDYAAVTDRATPLNLTHHGYFNLGGHGAGDVLGHTLILNADRFTPVDATLIPTGEIRPVRGTPFALRGAPLGARIDEADEQLRYGGGYDHNFVLNRTGAGLTLAARLHDPGSGRVLEVHTTEPGLQLYSGNHLDGVDGKEGVLYGPRAGVALETQHFPDAPNHPHFPTTILRPGRVFRSRTVLRFSVA